MLSRLKMKDIHIKVARWQNLILSFPWIAPGWRAWGLIQGKEGTAPPRPPPWCNTRKGSDQILPPCYRSVVPLPCNRVELAGSAPSNLYFSMQPHSEFVTTSLFRLRGSNAGGGRALSKIWSFLSSSSTPLEVNLSSIDLASLACSSSVVAAGSPFAADGVNVHPILLIQSYPLTVTPVTEKHGIQLQYS